MSTDNLLAAFLAQWTETPVFVEGQPEDVGADTPAYVVVGCRTAQTDQLDLLGHRETYVDLFAQVYVPIGTGATRAWRLAEVAASLLDSLVREQARPVGLLNYRFAGDKRAWWGIEAYVRARMDGLA